MEITLEKTGTSRYAVISAGTEIFNGKMVHLFPRYRFGDAAPNHD
jgi:hypothetical protein